MITHETSDGEFKIEVERDGFTLFLKAVGSAEYVVMNRHYLTELRHIIDQALNTSAEELGDA